ncbi:MAG: hypothetical protein WBC51_01025 [Vicinamibacterales bacterium]
MEGAQRVIEKQDYRVEMTSGRAYSMAVVALEEQRAVFRGSIAKPWRTFSK